MYDYHSKEIKSKVLRKFSEWIFKSSKSVSIQLLIYNNERDLKLDKNIDDLSIILIG